MIAEPRRHPADPGEPQHGIPRVGIARDEEPLLAALGRGRSVLEIGTGLGYSARAFLAGGARRVVTVDIDPWVGSAIVPALPKGIGFRGDWPPPGGRPFDVVFVDGAHDKESVREDTRRALAAVVPGGLVVFHDWEGIDRIPESVRSVVGPGATIYAIPTTYGLGILVAARGLLGDAKLSKKKGR